MPIRRTVGIDRTFSLGNYKSLKVSDFISGIPEELALNPTAIDLLRHLQLLQVDKTFLGYQMNTPLLKEGLTPEQCLEIIDETRISVLTQFKDLLNGDFKDMEFTDAEETK